MYFSTFLIVIKQGRAAPAARAAPSSTEKHRAAPGKTQQVVKGTKLFMGQEY